MLGRQIERHRKKLNTEVKEDMYMKLYLSCKKTGHVVDSKGRLSGLEASEKLFIDNQKCYLEGKR